MDVYALGPFSLDTVNSALFHGSEPIALGRRAVALLRTLIERPGALVSKEVLIEAAWPGQAVEDSNLPVQIAALRRALGKAPGGVHWIETMPRRGYRFVGPVGARAENPATAASQIDAPRDTVPMWHGDAERRQITALSCELLGVGPEAGGTDLEDLRETIGDFRRCVSTTAARHAAVICRHIGNHVLVLFGYPEAHEHDVEQAIRTGLELCAVVRTLRPVAGVPMRCRVGIATGMVIIGDAVGGDALGGSEVVGDVPNLAARLLASAQPDMVAIDRVTRHLIGKLFVCRALGALQTSCDTEPMRRWQVLRESIVASRFEALRGLKLTRLVGRDEEIDLLLRRWARSKAGAGQVILVAGEAGIGKSRITAAFAERLHGEPHFRLRYFCSPYHQDSALFPVIDQLGRAAGFARDDPPASRLEKLEALLARVKPPDDDVALLADLMSLPASERHPLPNLSPQRKKERTLEALIRQLERLARENPVVAAFEDVHWLDPTSRELLDLAIEHVRRLPVLLIVTFRPEFQPPWAGQPQVTMLELNRLDRRDRTALIAQIARGKKLPDEVVAQIAERTDGVPLFVEELTKSVLESSFMREETDRYVLDGPLQPFAIPMTLHASLLARLDRSASVRHVAQVGAVIGRQFSYPVLHAVSRLPEDELHGALAQLVASELVFQRGTPPDSVYSFKHALVQDAAHGSLLRSARQQLHARIAAALEAHSPELMDSQPELFAQHYAEGGLVEKSVTYWSKASRRSVARSAMAEAAEQLRKGLDQLALLPDTPERQSEELKLHLALAGSLTVVKGYAHPEVAASYSRACSLISETACTGTPIHFSVLRGLWAADFVGGKPKVALDHANQFLSLAQSHADPRVLAMGRWLVGRVLITIGDYPAATSQLERAVLSYRAGEERALDARLSGPDVGVTALAAWGLALWHRGFPDRARRAASAALQRARQLRHLHTLAYALLIIGMATTSARKANETEEVANELVALSDQYQFAFFFGFGEVFQGWAMAQRGEGRTAVQRIREGLAAVEATGWHSHEPGFLGLLAEALALTGAIDDALKVLTEALASAEAGGARGANAELHRLRGEMLRCLPSPDWTEVGGCFRTALAVAREQGTRGFELRAAVSLARLWREQGRRAEARALLAPVYGWFTEGFATPDLEAAKMLLDGLE